jgi:N-acetylmuramate 1-kinase
VALELSELKAGLATLGLRAKRVDRLAGDASQRVFFRVTVAPSRTVVACLYPVGQEDRAFHDSAVQQWGWERRLPLPRPIGRAGRVVVSADLGDEDLEVALGRRGEAVLAGALDTLERFQSCPWRDLPTPPFDAAFFRAELRVFEEFSAGGAATGGSSTSLFLDRLAEALGRHPFRLVHRDFHANNLFVRAGRVITVDFQDMRGGPDTYDLVSLLRERAGAEALRSEADWQARAARMCGWDEGWRQRYMECAAQRGLKVIGTFRRLAAGGARAYLRWLPPVQDRTREAILALAAPRSLLERVVGPPPGLGV